MFFPIREYPTAAMEAALAGLGVVCRVLPEVPLPRSNATDTETDLSGFTMKVAALLLSRFQEVRPVSWKLCMVVSAILGLACQGIRGGLLHGRFQEAWST